MLHLIFQSPTDIALLERLESGDVVVFLENAVFQVNKGSAFHDQIQCLLKKSILFYVLKEEIESRGLTVDKLISAVGVLDYSGLVELTENNKVIRTWN